MNTCLLCTFHENCERSSFALYATTPIVKDILVGSLWDAQIAHRIENGIISLDASITDEQLASALKQRLTEIEMRDIRITKSRGAEIMNAPSLLTWLKHSDTSWFDRALAADRFTTYFQPIIDYSAGLIHGHECLVRLQMERTYNGGEIIEAAVTRGRIHAFDSYVRQLSVRLAGRQHTAGTKVFINFMPSSIYDPAFCMRSTLEALSHTKLRPEEVVFEVVESEAITDVAHLKKICNYYREHGFKFALDDVGTGANSLQMVCDLQPDYMKIDKSLISGLGKTMYRAATGKLVDLANEFGVQVIAEGIEDATTAQVCSSLGITLMQGYHFARPAPSMVTTATSLINLALHVNAGVNTKINAAEGAALAATGSGATDILRRS
jgi:EAL domain-containing protein (putative c-di-GMP-specific phosphodiesterase class I)